MITRLFPVLLVATNALAATPAQPPPKQPWPSPTQPPPSPAMARVTAVSPAWTMGHSFPKGAVPAGKALACSSGAPVQIDQRTDWPDGSMRFGVLSAVNASGTCTLTPVDPKPSAALPPVAGLPVTIELDIYEMQRSRVTLGVFTGSDATKNRGFAVGDVITVTLDGTPFTYTVTTATAGLTEQKMTALAIAVLKPINDSRTWIAEQSQPPNRYNRFVITRQDKSPAPFSIAVTTSSASTAVTTEELTQASPRVRWTARNNDKDLGNWLDGPLVRESWTEAPFSKGAGTPHPHLTARFGARQYGPSAASRHQVVVENAKTWTPGPRNFTYDVRILVGSTEVLRETARVHEHHSRWSRVFGDPGLPARDWRYLRASKAVLNYVEVKPEAVLKNFATRLATADNSVTGPSIVTQGMPTAGGRWDIGPLPTWGAALIASGGDERALAATLAAAHGGATAPIHYRDERTGRPVSADEHPTTTFKFGAATAADTLPALDPLTATSEWGPDTPHQPSLHAFPYMLTGDRFFLEELHFWANWSLMQRHPGPTYRDGAKLIVAGDEERGFAWTHRTMAHVLTLTPTSDPFHAYMLKAWRSNIDALYARWWLTPKAPWGTPSEGIFPRYNDVNNTTAPWMANYNIFTFGLAAEQELPRAREVLERGAKFAAGLYAHEADGWCRVTGGGIYYAKTHNAGVPYPTWRALAEANKADMPGWPACPAVLPGINPGGREVIARAALQIMADAGIAEAVTALAWHIQAASNTGVDRIAATYASDPSFALAPRNNSGSKGKESPTGQ
jgi:hypothetical protein